VLFVVTKGRKPSIPSTEVFPCITLYEDNWNDFGFTTLFHAYLWLAPNGGPIVLGGVKIIQKDKKGTIVGTTSLPRKFSSLSPNYYCSLGQGRKYYEELRRHKIHIEVLEALQDVLFNPRAARGFENDPGFDKSLLRFSEAAALYSEGAKGLGLTKSRKRPRPKVVERLFSFTFKFNGFDSPHNVSCDFRLRPGLPSRVLAFVGKNGTGKTAVLAEMATHMSGTNSEEIDPQVFQPERPSFSRTIVISYSPFGPFRYPAVQTSSYRYCGLLNEKGEIDRDYLTARLLDGINEIHRQRRKTLWRKSLETVGLHTYEPVIRKTYRIHEANEILELWRNMSSGHFYTAAVITDMVANLSDDSMLLIDEPELYLHPNMVSGLLRAISALIEENQLNSYAIVATHSPVVVQELLGEKVVVFTRLKNEPHCSPLDFESFGENLTTIVNQVFGVTRNDKNYMRILDELSEGRTESEVDALFEGRLGMNALGYVGSVTESKG